MSESSEKCLDSDCNFIGGDYHSLEQMSSRFSFKKAKSFQSLSAQSAHFHGTD